jgi:hypothetical protein
MIRKSKRNAVDAALRRLAYDPISAVHWQGQTWRDNLGTQTRRENAIGALTAPIA